MSRAGLARHDPRRDGNEKEIMSALQARGFQVWQISGKGVCDLLCCVPDGRTFLVECKMPGKTLTEAQKKFHPFWKGEKYIVYHASEVNAIPFD